VNNPKLAGRSTVDPVSLSQGSPGRVNLMIRAELHQVLAARRGLPSVVGDSAVGSHYGQQWCAWAAHPVPEPRGRWPGPFSHAGRLG